MRVKIGNYQKNLKYPVLQSKINTAEQKCISELSPVDWANFLDLANRFTDKIDTSCSNPSP